MYPVSYMYQVVPGPRRGGSFEKMKWLQDRKSMADRKVFAVQKQWSVGVVSGINDWANSCWDGNEMNESMHRSLSERMYHDSTNQWISGTMSRRINESMNQWISESTNHWFNNSVSQWINESIKGSTVEWLNESMNQGLTRINESMKEWIDESLNHWRKEPMNQSILPTSSSKSALILFFLRFWSANQTLATVSCTFCQLHHHFQKCSDPISFWWNANWALATVWCIFCRPHFPKVLRGCQFFSILKCKSSSRRSPAHFLSTTFADRVPHPRKQRSYFGNPRSHITRTKPKGFARESVFNCEFTRVRTVSCRNYLMTDGWHLTWWCGWHDGGSECWIWQSPVTRKFPN